MRLWLPDRSPGVAVDEAGERGLARSASDPPRRCECRAGLRKRRLTSARDSGIESLAQLPRARAGPHLHQGVHPRRDHRLRRQTRIAHDRRGRRRGTGHDRVIPDDGVTSVAAVTCAALAKLASRPE
jgi:hypothetical protein